MSTLKLILDQLKEGQPGADLIQMLFDVKDTSSEKNVRIRQEKMAHRAAYAMYQQQVNKQNFQQSMNQQYNPNIGGFGG